MFSTADGEMNESVTNHLILPRPRSLASGRLLVALSLLAAGALVAGCSSEPPDVGCVNDDECPQGGICFEGACAQLCSESVPCVLRDQTCVDGVCVTQDIAECENQAGTACDDGNPCTEEDRCTSAGACVGVVMTCDDAPDPECVESDTVFRSYDPVGSCNPYSGDCEYPSNDTACPNCNTACLLACAALTCDDTHDGCRLGTCLPGPPASCDYTNRGNGTDCTIESTGSTGACQDGDCICTPDCVGKDCGPDGCGDVCGTCEGDDVCQTTTGECVTTCIPDCPNCRTVVVSDGCEGECAINCVAPGVCDSSDSCCSPDCPPCRETAVADGCGGTCAANCDSPSVCDGDSCCAPDCDPCRETSSPDGCGGTCSANCTGDDQCCGNTCTSAPTSCPSGYTDCGGDWCNPCDYWYDDDPSCYTLDVEAICGDDDPVDVRVVTGYREEWIFVPVTECNSLGVGPVATFSLTMPDCADFDLYVLWAKDTETCADAQDFEHCAGTGTFERLCVGWTDYPAVNNSRNLYAQVRAFHETATCCGEWELTIRGNTCWTATSDCDCDDDDDCISGTCNTNDTCD